MKQIINNKLLLLIIFNLLTIVNCQLSIAQQNMSSSKKASKFYEEAVQSLNKKKYADAEDELKKAISKDNSFIEAYLLLGDVYYYEKKPEDAIDSYKKALEINSERYPNIYFTLAQTEFSIARYEDAKKHYLNYIQSKDTDEENFRLAKKSLDNCDFAINAIKNPVPFKPKNLGAGVNSKSEEYFPCLTVDGKTLLYTRLVQNPESANNMGLNEDFFISHLSDSSWTQSEDIGKLINTPYNEGAPCLSPDGQILIFTACEVFGDYGSGRKGYGSCDLFFSRKLNSNWTEPINMGAPINSRSWESQPSYSSDGRTIYFIRRASNKSDKKVQYIYKSELGEDGRWGVPVKLNDKINVPGCRQESVFIHPDNQTLYFSSNGPTGMGGMDIFMSRKGADGDWGEAVNLGYPINTVNDENSFTVSGDGKTAFFASDRKEGYGGLDLYSFDLPQQNRPLSVSYMRGRIYDKESKKPMYARFELIDLETGRTAIKSFSNKGNGEFMVCLPANKNYALNVSSDKYLFYSENFEIKNTGTILNPVIKDILLQPIKIGETVVLRNIFFETAKYELKPESEIELNKLIELLNKNPKMKNRD